MRDIRNEVGVLSETLGGLAGLGRTLTYTVTAPVLAMGTAMVQQAGDFEAAMRNINSIVGVSEEELAALSQQVLDFGKNTRGGVQDSAEALYTVFSAGIMDTATAFNIMSVASKTAEAGLADLQVTTQSIVSTQLAFGDTSEEMTNRVSNALTRMVQIGVGSMDEFAHATGNIVPNANALGIEVEELYGTLAVLTQRGVNAATASTNLTNAMSSLVKPTEAMEAAFASLGVNGAEELIDQFGGLSGALKALVGTTDGTQESINALFNNIRGARAVNSLFGDVAGWDETMQDFYASLDGATMRAWDEQMMSFAAQWDLLQSALSGAAITIGNQLLPMVTPLVMGLTDLVIAFTELDPSIIQMGITIAGVVAAGAPLLWLVSGLLMAINPLTIGIALAATAIATNWDIIVEAFEGAASRLTGVIAPVQSMLDSFWGSLMPEEIALETPEVAVTGEPTVIDPMSIITVDTAKSLWQIFTEQGYDDYFSWQEFMRLAEQGGWQGGAIEVGSEITIDMSTVRTLPPEMPLVHVDGHSINVDSEDITSTVQADIDTAMAGVDWGGLFDDLNFDYAASGLGDLFTGVIDFSTSLAGADWSGLMTLGAALLIFTNGVIGASASALGALLTGVGGAIRGVVDAISLAMDGDIAGALETLGGAFTSLFLGFAGAGAALITGVTDALNALFDLDIPSFTDWFNEIQADLANASLDPTTVQLPVNAEIYLTDTFSGVANMSTLLGDVVVTEGDMAAMTAPTITVSVPANIDWRPEAVTAVLDVAAMTQNLQLTDAEKAAAGALLDAWSSQMSEEDRAVFQDVLSAFYSGGGLVVTPDGFSIQVNADGSTVQIGDVVGAGQIDGTELNVGEIQGTATLAMVTANGWVVMPPVEGEAVATLTNPVEVEAPVTITSTAEVATTFGEGFAAGMDADTIIATYLTPVETKWNAMFAPEGAMTLNLGLFVANMTAQAILIDEQALVMETTFTDMATSGIADLDRFANKIGEISTLMDAEFGAAVLSIEGVMRAITSLLSMEGIVEVSVDIGSSGVQTDGSHAGGLANVPYDGYIAELHAGERVMTAEENKAYGSGQMSAATIMGTPSNASYTNNNTQVTVQAQQSVDDFLFELERRGYKLDKR